MGRSMDDIEIIKPLNDMTAPEVLEAEGRFTNFIRALEISGVGGLLEKKGPHTVFAPVDDAFNETTIGSMISSMKLDMVLHHFIVAGKYTLEDLKRQPLLKSVNGYPLVVSVGEDVEVNGARIIKPDVPYNRGIIHEIDRTEDKKLSTT